MTAKFTSMTMRRRLGGQGGFSLVELMVALLVGLMVVGALLSTYYATTVSNRHAQAMAQITEDASIAFNMLRSSLSQVGYSQPTGYNTGTNKFIKRYAGVGLFGCDDTFADTSLAIESLTCTTTTGATSLRDAIAVAYEADVFNSVKSGTSPMDCLGNTWTAETGGTWWKAYHRYYVDKPSGATKRSLYCRGPGNATAQALVENIEDMQITYGVATTLTTKPIQISYYASAYELTAADFANVASVRVCLLVASTAAVMDKTAAGTWPQYRNCQQGLSTPSDGRMYRAFTSTIVLQNRLGVMP